MSKVKGKPSMPAKTWHVFTIREWRTSAPMALVLKEIFTSEAKAKAVAREMRKEGLGHVRCLCETHYVVQSPKDIEWITCKDSGRSNLYIKRAEV